MSAKTEKKVNLRALCVTAIMGGLGAVLMALEFPITGLMPSFIKLDFSELPALITSFAFGPQWGILVCLIKNLLHLIMGSTMGVGELSNFILGAIFVGTAGAVYKAKGHKSRKRALIGCVAGTLAMAVLSVATNYFIVYPLYGAVLGLSTETIVAMYSAILPAADTLLKALLIFNLPFNIAKGIIDSAICFLLYKPLSPILKGRK